MSELGTRLRGELSARFAGSADPGPLWLCRTLIAAAALVRTSDVLRPLIELDHHRWVHGVEFAPWAEGIEPPRLAVGLLPGLGVLATPVLASMLVVLRGGAALSLLVGLWPRASALLLGVSGYALMASDRFRYLHHLHLLWTSCLLLALVPWSARPLPKWPLTLIRWQVLVIYAASGVAKLDPQWLDGSTLEQLAAHRLIDPGVVEVVGAPLLAQLTCATELILVPLLMWPRTRWVGIALAIAFHLSTDTVMVVSTFPVVMIALVVTFAPTRRERTRAASSLDAEDEPGGAPSGGRDDVADRERLLVRREP
jgi:hypothetical protein